MIQLDQLAWVINHKLNKQQLFACGLRNRLHLGRAIEAGVCRVKIWLRSLEMGASRCLFMVDYIKLCFEHMGKYGKLSYIMVNYGKFR